MNPLNRLARRLSDLYKNRLFFRFFTGYLCVIMLAVLFFSLFYSTSRNILLSKQSELNKNTIQYMQYIIDNQIKNILESTELFQNMSGSNYIKGIDKINNQVGITSTLSNLKGHINIIDFCFVYNPDLEYILTDSGSISKDVFFKDILKYKTETDKHRIIEKLHSDEYLSILSSNQSYNAEDEDAGGMHRYITIIQGFGADYNKTKLVTLIDENKLFSLIPVVSAEKYLTVSLLNSKGGILASMGDTDQLPDISKLTKKSGRPSGEFNSKDNFGFYIRSNRLDGVYVLMVSKAAVLGELRFLRIIFIFMLFVITFLGILEGFYFSWKNASPIKKIIQRLIPEYSRKNDSANALDRLSNAVFEIKKDNENYEFRQKLTHFLKTSETDARLEKSFPRSMFAVLVLKTVFPTELDGYLESFIHKNSSFFIKYLPYGDKSYCLVINAEKLTDEALFLFAIELHDYLFNNYDLFSTIGIGKICNCFKDITFSLTSALNAIKQGLCSSEIYVYGSMEQSGHENIIISDNFETTILECVQIKNKNFAINSLENIFNNNNNLSNASMKHLVLLLINTFVKICKKSGMNYDITNLLNVIEDEYRIDKLKEYMISLYSFLFTNISEYSLEQSEKIKNYIIDFVKENYSDSSITIAHIAKKLGLSVPYISTVFKKSNGTGFSQYLSECRIEVAKELLTSTKDKINDVAKKSGFGSYNSFSRTFHALTGYTPRDYRYTYGQKNL